MRGQNVSPIVKFVTTLYIHESVWVLADSGILWIVSVVDSEVFCKYIYSILCFFMCPGQDKKSFFFCCLTVSCCAELKPQNEIRCLLILWFASNSKYTIFSMFIFCLSPAIVIGVCWWWHTELFTRSEFVLNLNFSLGFHLFLFHSHQTF